MRLIAFLFLAPFICRAQQPPMAPAPAMNCAADGMVVNSVTGEPVPRARVVAMGQIQNGQIQSGTGADSAGRWQMSGIPCGRLNIYATKTGFLNAVQGRLLTPRSEPGATVAPDAPLHGFRIEMVPQSVVTGKVIDESGDPITNAAITVNSSRVIEGKRSFQQTSQAITNDLGEYRIPALPAGKIILCARAPLDLQTLEIQESTVGGESCYPGPVDGGGASAMSLPAGREARVDFTLTRVPAARIRGKVTGMPENSGVGLTLIPRSLSRVGGVQGRPTNMQRDGTFEVRGVPPGAWTLSVDYWEAGKRLMGRVPVDVNGSDLEGIVVHLESGFTVTGTVRVDSQSGAQPKPQQINVSLRAVDPTGGTGAVQWDKTHTTFTITDVTPGSYFLNANAAQPFYVRSATLGGRDMVREALPLMQAGGPIEVVVADDGGSLSGQVQDSNGDGTSGWVMVWREGRQPVPAVTGPDGRFKIGGLAPGDYRVFAWDDYTQVEYADPDWMRRNGGSGQAVTVSAGQTVELKLPRVNVPRD